MGNHGRVLICGAGPTGLVAAISLIRSGIDVQLIDAASEPSPLSKAAVIWRRTLEVLHDSVPSTRFVESGRVMDGIQLEADGRILRRVDFPRDSAAFPPGVLLPQADTERILTEVLADLGGEIRRGVRLKNFESVDGRVRVTMEDGDDHRVEDFDWLIGADGAHSAVRHTLGIDFPGKAIDRRWLLADLDFEDSGPEDRVRMFVGRQGMAGLFPYGHGRWRLIADGGPIDLESPRRDPDLAEIESEIRKRTAIEWKIDSAPWLAEFRVNERQVESCRHGRVLLAGDAAHVHSPAGGQGMNTSIQDGVNAAWKLAMVMRGEACDGLLDTYQDERHPVGAEVVRNSGRALKFATDRRFPAMFFKRRILPLILGIGAIRRKLVQGLSEIDIDYRKGPLAEGRRDGWIGRRLPDLPLEVGGASVYESIDTTGFTILAFNENTFIEGGAWDRAILAAGSKVRVVRTAPSHGQAGTLRREMDMSADDIAVVRPDTYLGPVTSDPDQVVRWFEALRGRG